MLKKTGSLFFSVLVALTVFFVFQHSALEEPGKKLLSIFIFTILLIMLRILPLGQSAMTGLTLCVVTKTLTFQQAFSGFLNPVVWLITIAFFIARGFVKTGLGLRIAYQIMKRVGKSSLGLGYGIALTDFFIAPAIPSNTARSGGVIFPVVNALAQAFGSDPAKDPKKIGAYLIQVAFQTTNVSGAIFLTAMAGNPLIVELAHQAGISINWLLWLKVAFLPGFTILALVPFVLYYFYPPEIKKTEEAKKIAEDALHQMGPMKRKEKFLLAIFFLLLNLWIFGSYWALDATTSALIGLIFLLLFQVLSWEEVIQEKNAWDTLIWFSTLVMMANFLNQFGFIRLLSLSVAGYLEPFPYPLAFFSILLVYYYSHYFFASNVAHIGAMFAAFLAALLSIQAPPLLSVFILAMMSNLFGSLTHYGSGPAPILYAAGYLKVGTWWKIGFWMSLFYLVMLFIAGGVYWKILGLY